MQAPLTSQLELSSQRGLTAFNGTQWSERVSPAVFWQWVKAGYIAPNMPVHWPSFDPFPLPASAVVQPGGYRVEAAEALLGAGLALQHDGAVICPNNGSLGDGCVQCGTPAVRSYRVRWHRATIDEFDESDVSVWVGVCATHRYSHRVRRRKFGLCAQQFHNGTVTLTGVNSVVLESLPLVA
jgi:hypothetical protein